MVKSKGPDRSVMTCFEDLLFHANILHIDLGFDMLIYHVWANLKELS
jgi:hypothetical protein